MTASAVLVAAILQVLAPPEYAESARIALEATLRSLDDFSNTLGEYPYKQVTVVVPPFNGEESGGMEYETFFTTIGALWPREPTSARDSATERPMELVLIVLVLVLLLGGGAHWGRRRGHW